MPRPSSTPPSPRVRTRSIPDTAFYPSARSCRSCAQLRASFSSGRRRIRSSRSATSCGRVPKPRQPTCRSCRVVRPVRLAEAQILAKLITAPLLVKAVGGGGGRGLKRIERLEDLPELFDLAAAEAGAAFGDARIYLERYIDRGRHVEVQVLGDGEGRVIQLGRARLLRAAPLPEAHRGDAGSGAVTGAAQFTAASRRALRATPALSRRRNGRIHRGHTARDLLFS